MSTWHTNPDGTATFEFPPAPDDLSSNPETAARQMSQALQDANPEWVCAECGRSLFKGPVFAGKGDIFQPPFATCSPQHGFAQGSTLYKESDRMWREDLL